MPRAIEQGIRTAIWQAHQKEKLESVALAQRFGLPRRTVQDLLLQARRNDGTMPSPAYHSPEPASKRLANDPIFLQAQALRREHPEWGSEIIRIILTEHYPEGPVPSSRSLQRWFDQVDLLPALPGRRLLPVYRRATAVHQTWQIDAIDQVPLADNSLASCLRCIDECSGAFLGSRIFPPSVQRRAACGREGGTAGDVRPLRVAQGAADG